MNDPTTAREALIVEAVGDTAKLIRQVEALAPLLTGSCEALLQAKTELSDNLAAFESRMAAITENAKTRAVHHLAMRVDETARRSIEQQSRAMADAARVAFGAELGAAMQQLRSALQPLMQQRHREWEWWLTHLGAAAAGSAAVWIWVSRLGCG
ncbi:MAG TPA: hypothetical protein VFM98_10160 [Ramlibacter sp.]|uniref:hypothetical protein n=1 Tax=Ramlibacter sp. TaxID=1917967 RepID=UPI002D7EF555|nr:hypothetical protein [Ramlibacter sp.]HET8745960.1 hypothetical protein [Ramlibacter sp.]